MRTILICLASTVALAFAEPVAAQDSGAARDVDPALAGVRFWENRAADRINNWLYDAHPSSNAVPPTRGRNRIGTVRGSSPWQHWSRSLTRVRLRYNVCDEPNRDVTWSRSGDAYVTYRSGGPNGVSDTQTVRFWSSSPLELTFHGSGLTVRVDATELNFTREYDVLDRYSQAFRRGMDGLSTLNVRFNAAERAAYERDPAAFERGVYLGIDDQCDS